MMDANVTKYLPHRPPFLFVDEFSVTPDGKVVCGSRTFRDDDFFFAGHFPDFPVVPGVILVEAMAQCGGAGLVKLAHVPENCNFLLASVRMVKFRNRVVPGDKFDMRIETVKILKNRFLVQRGHGFVGNLPAVEAEWVCAMVPRAES